MTAARSGEPVTGVVRAATPADLPTVLELIHELARYEREPDAVQATEEDLRVALFGPQPAAFCHVVAADGAVAGFALGYFTFSTWTGQRGVHLEDLFVRPAFRGRRYGAALLVHLAQLCTSQGYTRLEWDVLDWNEPAIGFYRSLGAVPVDGWTRYRLAGTALGDLGEHASVR